MKKLISIHCLLLILSFILYPSTSYAQLTHNDFKVKPIIVIPLSEQKKVTPQLLEIYKQNIREGLEDIQTFYASKLNGKTFKIDREFQIINAPKDFDNLKTVSTYDVFLDLGGYNLVPLVEGQVNAIWFVGARKNTHVGGAGRDRTKDISGYGIALSDFNSIQMIARNNPDKANRNVYLQVLAHELGHGFGLVLAGWAKGHPCTEISPHECVDSAPKPYPPAIEWNSSVMGYGSQLRFPNVGFNNSYYNPEIQQLYNSSFINPQTDNAPAPVPTSFLLEKTAKVSAINTPNIDPGEQLEIKGENFGNIKGEIIFYEPKTSNTSSPPPHNILKWSNSNIVVEFPADQIGRLKSKWKIGIKNQTGIVGSDYTEEITITPQMKPSLPLTFNVKVICQDTNEPVPNFAVLFEEYKRLSSNGKIFYEGFGEITLRTNAEGIITRDFNLPDARSGDSFSLSPRSIGVGNFGLKAKVNSEYKYITVPKSPGNYKESDFIATTPESIPERIEKEAGIQLNCKDVNVKSFIPSPIPTQQPEITSVQEEETIPSTIPYITNPSPDSTTPEPIDITLNTEPSQIVISNYPDFRDTNTPLDRGNLTSVVPVEESNIVTWEVPASEDNQTVYIREEYTDGTIQEYEANVNDDDTLIIPNTETEMVVQEVKHITRVLINDREVNLDNPEIDIQIEGNDGVSADHSIPVVIEYSDGSVDYLAYNFSYNPPQVQEDNQPSDEEQQQQEQEQSSSNNQYASECGQNGGDEYCNYDWRGGDPDNPEKYACDVNSPSQYGDGCYDR